jgi:hypothetical protein
LLAQFFPALTRWANEFRPSGLVIARINNSAQLSYVSSGIVPQQMN